MDIAEQLRRDAYAPHFTSVGAANLMILAADEIERLRKEVSAWRKRFPAAGFNGDCIVMSG